MACTSFTHLLNGLQAIYAYQKLLVASYLPVLLFLILWFIKSLELPRESNISGSD